MAVEPLLLVGLDEPETAELRRRLDRAVLALETLPRIRVDRGRLMVEHPHFMNHFVPVERVAYHAIFEDDFDFLTALALWGGPCLPGALGMMDLRLRVGVDYMVAPDGGRYLLEVNHVPNVTVFPEVREAYLDLVVRWASEPTSS